MKRISMVLFTASLALFLLSLANLSPGPTATSPPKTVEVFGTVDVGNLSVDDTVAIRVTNLPPHSPNFASEDYRL